MARKAECIIYVSIMILLSIIAALTFFEASTELLKFPAYLLALVLLAKIIIELFLRDFHVRQDDKNQTDSSDEMLRLECDVKNNNSYILAILLLWLAVILVGNANLPIISAVLKLTEKLLAAYLIVLSIYIIISLTDIKKCRCDLKKEVKPHHQKL